MDNINKPASELTKLEYALIHSNWEPKEEEVERIRAEEKKKNPYNQPHVGPLHRRVSEVVKDLKLKYFTLLLT